MNPRKATSGHARKRHVGSAWLLVSLALCAPLGANAAVYGEDDRRELVDHGDAAIVDVGKYSVVSIMRAPHWNYCGEAPTPKADTPTLMEWFDLCPEVPFGEQLVVSQCSAVLVDYDLVATAAHCMDEDASCSETLFALGLYNEGGEMRELGFDDVYHCRRVVSRVKDSDLLIMELDRAVKAPYRPAAVALETTADEALLNIGFPSYVPMKVADNCTLISRSEDRLNHNCETFNGNSGGATFNAAGEVVGVVSKASGNYKPTDQNCSVPVVFAEDGTLPGVTDIPQLAQSRSLENAIAEICAVGRKSALCGLEPECGDGECTGAEDAANCAADCAEPSCGDGVCEYPSERECLADCAHLGCVLPDEEPDAGVSASDAGGEDMPSADSGCGCHSTPSSAPSWPALALFVGVFCLVGRQRRRL